MMILVHIQNQIQPRKHFNSHKCKIYHKIRLRCPWNNRLHKALFVPSMSGAAKGTETNITHMSFIFFLVIHFVYLAAFFASILI